MKRNQMRLVVRRAAAFALSGTLLASSLGIPSTAFARPNIEYQAAMDELDNLQMELAQSEAVLGKTTYDLAVIKANIDDLMARIDQNKIKLDQAKRELAIVIADNYKQGGDSGLIDLILSSKSFERLISRVYYANRMAKQKETAINLVNNLMASMKSDLHVLVAQKEELETLLANQAEEFAAMQDAATRQANYVSSLAPEIIQAMEQDRIESTIASLEAAARVLSVDSYEQLPGASIQVSTNTSTNDVTPAKTETTAKKETPAKSDASSSESKETSTPAPTEAAATESPALSALETLATSLPTQSDSSAASSSASQTSSTTSSTGTSNAASNALVAVQAALAQVGKSYGHENDGTEYDCNGLTNYAWAQAGVEIPYASGTYSYGQFQYMKSSDNWVTSEDELNAGDLVFFSQDGGDTTYHVAMYVGDGQIVHAIGYGQGIQVTDLDYVSGFVGGGTPTSMSSDATDYTDYIEDSTYGNSVSTSVDYDEYIAGYSDYLYE